MLRVPNLDLSLLPPLLSLLSVLFPLSFIFLLSGPFTFIVFPKPFPCVYPMFFLDLLQFLRRRGVFWLAALGAQEAFA